MLLSKWKLGKENVSEALFNFLCYKGFESIDIIRNFLYVKIKHNKIKKHLTLRKEK